MNDWNPKLPALIGTLAELKDYEKPVVEAYGRACARAGRDAALSAAPVAGEEPQNFMLGREYPMRGGGTVKLVSIENAGLDYETMACADGVHRYTRRLHPKNHGRVTGSDGTDPRDLITALAQPPQDERKGEDRG